MSQSVNMLNGPVYSKQIDRTNNNFSLSVKEYSLLKSASFENLETLKMFSYLHLMPPETSKFIFLQLGDANKNEKNR